MIQLRGVSKSFSSRKILNNLTLNINKGTVFGLVGPNGSGKSTILRLLCGVYQLDEGFISIGDKPVFDNIEMKKLIFFVSDDPYFQVNTSLADLKKFYMLFYPNFSMDRYRQLLKAFPINENLKINTMSKGMKRQALLIIALACRPMYLLLDEAFDGLDPVMRLNLKKLITDDISEREMSVIISSHNIRELEDICDSIGLLSDGLITFYGSKEELKDKILKVQIGTKEPIAASALSDLNIIEFNVSGAITSFVTHSSKTEIEDTIKNIDYVLFEYLPLTLEEIFVYEMEANGYGIYQD